MQKSINFFGFILLGLLIVLINGYFGQHPEIFQWDLTEDKVHTISPETKSILSEIEEPIELTFYFSEELSQTVPKIRHYAQSVKNLLARYSNLSDNKIKLRYANPEPYSETEATAVRLGLESVPLNRSGDRLYFGLVGTNSIDKQILIPFFQADRETFLEYDLSKMIATLNQPEKRTLGIMSGLSLFPKAGFALSQSSNVAFQQAKELFNIRELEPDVKMIESDIDLLVLVQPNALEPATLYAIDQFTLRGGKILAFVDPLAEALADGALESQHHLAQLFKQWGIEFKKDKILADANNALSIRLTPSGGPVRHPAIVGYDNSHFLSTSPIVGQLEKLNFSVSGVLNKMATSNINFEPLVTSSKSTSLIDLATYREIDSPTELINHFSGNQEVHTLAAQISGRIQTLFPGGAPEGVMVQNMTPHLNESESTFHAIIVADVDFITDRLWVNVQHFLGQTLYDAFANNGDFLVNAIESLLGNTALMGIRSRGVTQRPFTKIKKIQQNAEAEFRQKEQALQKQLESTESKLAELQSARDVTGVVNFNKEQQEALSEFIKQKATINQSLREVRHQLNHDIESLGTLLKVLNIIAIPLFIVLVSIILAIASTRKKRHHLVTCNEGYHE